MASTRENFIAASFRKLIGAASIVTLAFLFVACSSSQPLPIAARAGDSITLALGSQDDMLKNNTSAQLIPDATGTAIPLNLKSIFNLYPDKSSKLYNGQDVSISYLISGTSHEPWVTIAVLDLPMNIPTGFATIKINTTATEADQPNAKVENIDYRIEILPGSGEPHALEYQYSTGYSIAGDLSDLEPTAGQAHIIPPAVDACTPSRSSYAAIELTINLPYTIEPYRDRDWFRIVTDDLTGLSGEKPPQLFWQATGNLLKVFFIQPEGKLKCHETRFSLVPADPSYPFSHSSPPFITDVIFYSQNGQSVAGPPASDYSVRIK